ncbi:LytTR family DNA-binding domain-containing protein [Pedobacter sp. MC2016-24]|uniref:LytR/AlgR family response regulator transcription factor n=1 Tax=Pedobacter sp. MC2016-24 TaxID=2780090 RepID=UPI00187F0653|nr:LytTR family DNA-binding domain-containing protein [Pedobacter sp. MC2016-24]MBE9601558.1 response regulator transcription factor [Pedobacter sp. MC2016-24]
MNILIIEDEKHIALRLQRLVTEISDDYLVIGKASSVEESVQWILNNPSPDVALMDIRLSDGISFDIFKLVKVSFPIIFTTAYDEYAIRAFKVNSLDYLLKPIQKEELRLGLDRVKNIISPQNIEQLIELVNSKSKIYRKRFLLPAFDGFITIDASKIAFVYFEYKSTKLVLNTGVEEVVPYSLDELEDELDPEYFFRANRQFIVNIHSIERILNSFNGKLKIILKKHSEKEIFISKEKSTKFKEWLNQ